MRVKRIVTRRKSCILRLALISTTTFCWFSGTTWAGIGDYPVGARSLAMGGTYVALANTADAIFLNPGGLARVSGAELSLFYQKPFGLENVNFASLAATFPLFGQRFSAGITNLGNAIYTEQTFTLGFSHDFQERVFFGLALNYQMLKIDDYGSTGTPGIDIGFVVPLTDRLNWGFYTRNLNRPSISESEEEIAQTMVSGISFAPANDFIVNFEVYKEVRFDEEFRFGAEYTIFDKLALRTGIANHPDRFSAGFGLLTNPVRMDYAFFTHNDLGATHQVSLSFRIGGDREGWLAFPSDDSKSKVEQITSARDEPVVDLVQKSEETTETETPVEPQIVDLNKANIEQLTTLPGVGEKLAQAIIEFREANGPFQTIEDLTRVSGIGPAKFDKMKHLITITNNEKP